MVLRLKARESRSPPGLPNTPPHKQPPPITAGWSSPVARQAHNLKAAGSNPAPATTKKAARSLIRQLFHARCPPLQLQPLLIPHGLFQLRSRSLPTLES